MKTEVKANKKSEFYFTKHKNKVNSQERQSFTKHKNIVKSRKDFL
jgi:hypothetical protein